MPVHPWVLGFAAGFLVLLALYHLLTRGGRRLSAAGVLSHTEARLSDIQRVERVYRTLCPREARRLLLRSAPHRALMYREGTSWIVNVGPCLTVLLGVVRDGKGTAAVPIHYARANAPLFLSESAVRATATVEGMVEYPNSAVSVLALAPGPDSIGRYGTLAEARAALPVDTAAEHHFLFVNGDHDPVVYMVRSTLPAPAALVAGVAGARVYARTKKEEGAAVTSP